MPRNLLRRSVLTVLPLALSACVSLGGGGGKGPATLLTLTPAATARG